LLFSIAIATNSFSQSYSTESKNCGSCGKSVSNNSRVGMYCPHCGVRWGYENETKKTSTNYNYDYNYNSYEKTTGMTTISVNLRSGPSTSSEILKVLPSYASVSIISSSGAWYYVEYSYDYFTGKTIRGYVNKKYIN
jgi:predicted RNA-binding Zn-ribbon protein involved in translation (DUF1610 family)